MAVEAISADDIFNSIFSPCDQLDNAVLENFDTVDNMVLKNEITGHKRVIKLQANFEKLIHLMSNADTCCLKLTTECAVMHKTKILAHDWLVRGNCFTTMIKPFVKCEHASAVTDCVDFNKFLHSNRTNYANECRIAGDYVYWPHVSISYFGWRQFLQMKLRIDIGEYVPLIHHKNLGNVNLFDFNPQFFLNVEMSLQINDKKLFVNGRTKFTDEHDDLFELTMADGSTGVCKVNDTLVNSNKNFFDYIRDDINLTECKTSSKYEHLIRVNLKCLRLFKESHETELFVPKERLKVSNVISASSENESEMVTHIENCVRSVNEHMVNLLSKHSISDSNVLKEYFALSNYVNFDYLIIVVWQLMVKSEDFEFCETDIRLYLELLCECLYTKNTKEYDALQQRCDHYTKLTPKVFNRFCNHWTLFNQEDSLESLACYYAIHLLIYNKISQHSEDENECWDYSYNNAINCGADPEMLCKGFLKKIISANACMVFNGKHYVPVKKEDELFKVTEKASPILMASLKFNNWKYLYFTEEGVFNLLTNSYHSPSPFILGNTLMGALTKKSDTTYLPEPVIDFMLDNGKIENEVYKLYHVAKVCRDVKLLRNNMATIVAFNNCASCRQAEQSKLNAIFREIWNFSESELIIMGVYLNEKKMSDLIINLKCDECKQKKAYRKCQCYNNIEIDLKTFKIILIVELLSNNLALNELSWSLIYSSFLYTKILMDNVADSADTNEAHNRIFKFANFFHQHRTTIVDFLFRVINKIDHADRLIEEFANFDTFMRTLVNCVGGMAENENENEIDDDTIYKKKDNRDYDEDEDEDDVVDNDNDNGDNHDNDKILMNFEAQNNNRIVGNFYAQYCNVLTMLKNWNVWWDKLIVSRHNDDLTTWLVRFYTRVFLSKLNLKKYSNFFIKNIVMGYLYFRNFTNFNYVNSLLIMHFDASLGIPSDFEKCCIYCTGEPGSGKSSNSEMMSHIFVVHKRDADTYTLSKKETDEMEANKLISQLYVINELEECNDAFFKTTADSSKSNVVCRKFQGSQTYEANFKLMIINNKPLYIKNYDKGVRNRFAVLYMAHEFEENLPFSGSVYSHIKSKKYPMEKTYHEGLIKPVRLFLSHILMYKRNKKDGYISYKNIVKNDPAHIHNLMCLDVNNTLIGALVYVLRVQIKNTAKFVDESKVEKMIEAAAPYVELMIHDKIKLKRKQTNASRVDVLCVSFKKKFERYYLSDEKVYFNLDMAWNKSDFNTLPPTFK
ncbi:helicase [Artaxa digramma nucleopolyhedrovirus]|uniref:Helicase n=1 Tax=Artaxa digramma nucleopolyhedrovirus TaxID=3070910 RepID=A0AAE6UZN4_9ABAC|nr:helicase [Euproctis digramma nucleopolyhedrovirus]QHB21745.1 helicase [Artaxa digramma nucleopolyhedrovirus]